MITGYSECDMFQNHRLIPKQSLGVQVHELENRLKFFEDLAGKIIATFKVNLERNPDTLREHSAEWIEQIEAWHVAWKNRTQCQNSQSPE